jgi:hypothetical protein
VLMERNQELARLNRLLFEHAREGSRIAVISSAAMSGKTALPHMEIDSAAARGVRLLPAVASASERKSLYAIVERLYQGMPAYLQRARPWPGPETLRSPYGPDQVDLPLPGAAPHPDLPGDQHQSEPRAARKPGFRRRCSA